MRKSINFTILEIYVLLYPAKTWCFFVDNLTLNPRKKMNVHIAITSVVGKAVQQVLGLMGDQVVFTDFPQARIVLVEDKEYLMRVHTPDKHFVVVNAREPKNLPVNAEWHPITNLVVKLFELVAKLDTHAEAKETATVNAPVGITRKHGTGTKKILVIDDTEANRVRAESLNARELVIASNYDQAMTLINAEHFDVVLTDLYLPMSKHHHALSIDAIRIGETVPYGLLIALEAALHGADAAVVTDANHHQDCFSAAFDDFRKPYTVNDKQVRFFNNIGKNWNEALSALQ